jgi:hypothetical protein
MFPFRIVPLHREMVGESSKARRFVSNGFFFLVMAFRIKNMQAEKSLQKGKISGQIINGGPF